MATVTKYPQSNDAGFTNADNAHADDGVYATAAPAINSEVVGFWHNFDLAIPAGSGIVGQITIEAQWKLDTTASIHTFKMQAFLGNIPMGTELSVTTEPTADRTDTKSTLNGSWLVSQLNDNTVNGFRIRIRSVRGNDVDAVTMSLDYVKASVTYNAPPLAQTGTQTADQTADGDGSLIYPTTGHITDVVMAHGYAELNNVLPDNTLRAVGTAELVNIYAEDAHGTALLMPYVNITRAFLYDADVGYANYTTQANEDTADDVPLLPSVIGSGDAFYYLMGAYDDPPIKIYGLYIDVTTAGDGTYTLAWEYYNGSAWVSLDSYIATFGYDLTYKVTGIRKIDIHQPADIDNVTIDGVEAKWIRARYVSGAVTTQPKAKRIKVYAIAEIIGPPTPEVYYMLINEGLNLSDTVARSFTKILSERLELTVSIVKNIWLSSSNLIEHLRLYDLLSRRATLAVELADRLNLYDLVFREGVFSIVGYDRLTLLDSVSKRITKKINTDLEIEDLLIRTIHKTINDKLNLEDDEGLQHIIGPPPRKTRVIKKIEPEEEPEWHDVTSIEKRRP